jgi:hypothetical protein
MIPVATIVLGLVLNFIGIVSYMLSDSGSWTPLIPAIAGGLFLILGGMAMSAKLRKHVIHAALVIALLFGAMSIYKMIGVLADNGSALQMFSMETSAVACIAYLILGIQSFRQARRTRKAAAKAERAAHAAEV